MRTMDRPNANQPMYFAGPEQLVFGADALPAPVKFVVVQRGARWVRLSVDYGTGG